MSARGTMETRLADAERKINELTRLLANVDVRPARQRTRRFQSLLVKTDASHAKSASGTCSVYTGTPGSETDSGVNITAYNAFAALSSGKWAWAEHNGFGWYLSDGERGGGVYAYGSIGNYATMSIGDPLGTSVPLTICVAALGGAAATAATLAGNTLTIVESGRYLVTYGCGIIYLGALTSTIIACGTVLLSVSSGSIQHSSSWSCGPAGATTTAGNIDSVCSSAILDLTAGDLIYIKALQTVGAESFSVNSGFLTLINI